MALVAYQFVVACYYLAAVWRRTLYASANSYDDFRYSSHGREGSDYKCLRSMPNTINKNKHFDRLKDGP